MRRNFPDKHSPHGFARAAVVSLVALSLLSSAAGVSAQDGPSASQHAFAYWSNGRATEIAEGFRSVEGGAAFGRLAMTICNEQSKGRTCIGASFAKKLTEEKFLLDPSMTSATLTLRWDQKDHTIRWEGEGAPSASAGRPSRPTASTQRDARAQGSVFDREVSPPELEDAFLAQGNDEGGDERTEGFPSLDPIALAGASPAAFRETSLSESSALASNTNSCISYRRSEKRLAKLINEERKERDLNGLRLDTELGKVARKHTGEMVSKDLLHHTSLEELAARVTRWRVLGENVGVGDSIGALHAAFMDSPPHKENVLHGKYRHVGVGTKKVDGVTWVTVIFEARKDPGTTLKCT